jgi:diaminohydroxyphosphoribosylaminopyrimidine deaminase/5-amino-6-(5-phosphoribosylamino)uracil reductase
VNLEPCSHQGKTPPCVDKLVELGFKRVVIAMQDPNPLVDGKGIEKLKNAGIEVLQGVLEDEAKWLNRYFIKAKTTNRPYVILKTGQTLDGFIATNKKGSKWITGEESRKDVHSLRAELDAILVGSQTVRIDNPELTVRLAKGRNPKRIILDKDLSIPLTHNIYSDEFRKNTFVFTSAEQELSKKANTLSIAGTKVFSSSINDLGLLEINEILEKLCTGLDVNSLMVEGGSKLFSTFLEQELYDEVNCYISGKIFGNGMSPFNTFTAANVNSAPNLKIVSTTMLGEDVKIVAIKR